MNNIHLQVKQFLKINLFRNVKQINGQKMFKLLYQSCNIIDITTKIVNPQQILDKKFIYIKEGQIFIYKNSCDHPKIRSLIKSYRTNQYCGFQDYPLFWNQTIQIQISPKTTLVTVPLKFFYRLFRRVIPITYLQSKVQYLKKLNLFKGIQLERIFKIACLSHKYRVEKGQKLASQGDKINHIIIICSGRFQLSNDLMEQPLYFGRNQQLFVKETNQRIQECLFEISCVTDSDILVIPKDQYIRIIDIRYKLQETIPKDNQSIQDVQHQSQQIDNFRKIHSKTVYAKSYFGKAKTQGNDQSQTHSFSRTLYSATSKRQPQKYSTETYGNQSIKTESRPKSRGQIHYQKFVKRKQSVQLKSFFRYVQSRAPDIFINPSKQFSVIKPFYQSNSLYIKNMKRKMKKSSQFSQTSQLYRTELSNNLNIGL